MNNEKLIEALEHGVREAEEELRRRKEALAILKGKSPTTGHRGRRAGLRSGSLPALIFTVLKDINQPTTIAEIVSGLKNHNRTATTREVSIALARYVRLERFFRLTEDGKYALME